MIIRKSRQKVWEPEWDTPDLWWEPDMGLTESGGMVDRIEVYPSGGFNGVTTTRPTSAAWLRGQVPQFDGVDDCIVHDGGVSGLAWLHHGDGVWLTIGFVPDSSGVDGYLFDSSRVAVGRQGLAVRYDTSGYIQVRLVNGGDPNYLSVDAQINNLWVDEPHVVSLRFATAQVPQFAGRANGCENVYKQFSYAPGTGNSYAAGKFGALAGTPNTTPYKGTVVGIYGKQDIVPGQKCASVENWMLSKLIPKLWYKIDSSGGYVVAIQGALNHRIQIYHDIVTANRKNVWRVTEDQYRDVGRRTDFLSAWEIAMSSEGEWMGSSHGNEEITSAVLTVDGSPVSLAANSAGQCGEIVLTQESEILYAKVIVAETQIADGSLSLAAQPDNARKMQIVIVDDNSSISAGNLTLDGTEVIPLAGGTRTVTTSNSYTTVTTAAISGLVGGGVDDTIEILSGTVVAAKTTIHTIGQHTLTIHQDLTWSRAITLNNSSYAGMFPRDHWAVNRIIRDDGEVEKLSEVDLVPTLGTHARMWGTGTGVDETVSIVPPVGGFPAGPYIFTTETATIDPIKRSKFYFMVIPIEGYTTTPSENWEWTTLYTFGAARRDYVPLGQRYWDVYWDADYDTTGDPVTRWDPRVSRGALIAGTAPATSSFSDGRAALDFVSADSEYLSANEYAAYASGDDTTFVVAMHFVPTAVVDGQTIWSVATGVDATHFYRLRMGSGTIYPAGQDGGGSEVAGDATAPLVADTEYVMVFVRKGDTYDLYMNGASVVSNGNLALASLGDLTKFTLANLIRQPADPKSPADIRVRRLAFARGSTMALADAKMIDLAWRGR